jgi:hypothetical protein
MKFVFFNSYHHAHNGMDLCRRVGGKYHVCPKTWISNQLDIYKDIDNSDIVIIWNSLEPCTYWIKDICHQLNKPYLFLEYGFIPQKDMFHLDTGGIIKNSSLNNSLEWLTNDMQQDSEDYIDRFFANKKWKNLGEDYILCPLQLPWDTSIYLCSKYKNMSEFIDDVIQLYPNEQIIVTPHPLLRRSDVLSKEILNYQNIFLDLKNSTMHLAQRAKAIIGVTSTVLYETLAFGKRTIALGQCPIYTHRGDRRVALCAIQRQFQCKNVNKFLEITNTLLKNNYI